MKQMAGWVEDYSAGPADEIEWVSVGFKVSAQIIYMEKVRYANDKILIYAGAFL